MSPSTLQRPLSFPPHNPARGSVRPERAGVKRIVVSVDSPLFDRVGMLAAASRVSFAEAVRQLLERGLADSGVPRRARRTITPLASVPAEPVQEC